MSVDEISDFEIDLSDIDEGTSSVVSDEKSSTNLNDDELDFEIEIQTPEDTQLEIDLSDIVSEKKPGEEFSEKVDTNRLCGPKKTKENNAYSHNELVYLAVKNGLFDLKTASRLTMETLCKALKVPYTSPKLAGTKRVIFDDFGGCLKMKKDEIIKANLTLLLNKGFTLEMAKKTKKEELCNIIYQEESPFVVPEDFDESKCSLYDIPTLIRIATILKIDITRAKYFNDYCRIISLYYKRKKMNFNTEMSSSWDLSTDDYKCLIPLATDLVLQEHQKRVVRHILTHRGLLVVHATGSGKTLTAVTAINCMLAKYPNIKVLVVTPLTLIDNFKKGLIQFGLSIDNPDFVSRVDIKGYDEFVNSQKRKGETSCENTFLIIDEAHNFRTDPNIKNTMLAKGSKTYTMMKCAAQAFKVLLLSATPVVNRVYDLQNLLAMIDGVDPINLLTRAQFEKSVKSSDELYKKLLCKTSYYESPKENFPERIDIPLDETRIYMTDEYYDRYMKIERRVANPDILQGITLSDVNKTYFYHNLRMAVNALDKELSPKIEWIINFIIKEAEEGRKSVVYSNFKTAGMNLLRKQLDELNIPNLYAYITGTVTEDIRRVIVKRYNRDDVKILLITRAGGEGLDLKKTRNVIIMEANWNPAVNEQIIGRAIRYRSHEKLPPEERNVKVYRLMLSKPLGNTDEKKSVDDILEEMVRIKKELVDKVTEVIQRSSIEYNNCSCITSDNVVGCQSSALLQTLTKTNIELDVGKLKPYQAPEKTSLGIRISDVGKRLWLKLAGLKDLPIDTVGPSKKAKKVTLQEVIFDEDFELEFEEKKPEPVELPEDFFEELEETEKPEVKDITFIDDQQIDNIYTVDDPDIEISLDLGINPVEESEFDFPESEDEDEYKPVVSDIEFDDESEDENTPELDVDLDNESPELDVEIVD